MKLPGKKSFSDWNQHQYQLVDFGDGRKLERFGGILVDRVCPAAEGVARMQAALWEAADVRVDERGKMISGCEPTAEWQAKFREITFELKLTPFGHVGLFPEQSRNWSWLQGIVTSRLSGLRSPFRALNLFAYTGGTTLALAASGAEVIHVDASQPAVNWARRNADLSGLQGSPIRWIVEDAPKFVAREIRRKNKYDFIALDPPTYGHGPAGQRWDIELHLADLLEQCCMLLAEGPHATMLLTGHSVAPGMRDVVDMVASFLENHPVCCDRLSLVDSRGRSLDAGFRVIVGSAS